MFAVKDLPRAPNSAEYECAKEVFAQTGILTIKDKVTGKWIKPKPTKEEPTGRCGGVPFEAPYQDTVDYGVSRREGNHAEGAMVTETYMVRATYVRFVGTKKFPGGLAVGGYEVWRQDNFFEDTEKFSCTDFRYDIWAEEVNVLHAWAQEKPYVTDEMWKAAEVEARERRANMTKTQVDPFGVFGDKLVAFLDSKTKAGPPSELLAEIERLKAENSKLLAGSKK